MGRRGLSRTDVVLLILMTVFIGAILVSVLLPSLANGHRPSHRTMCALNLSGIGKALATYALGNRDMWPVPPHMPPVEDAVGRVRYAPGMIGTRQGPTTRPEDQPTTDQDTAMATTRVFWWTVVRSGAITPKGFICPSSEDRPNDREDLWELWDFEKWSEVSYGYQVPFGKYGKPHSDRDQDFAVAADKGPYGAALEAGRPHPGAPTLTSNNSPDDWMPFNSPNHDSEGQNVMYPDGHVDWYSNPLAGVYRDNIYTRWSTPDGGSATNESPRVQGTPPTGIETPWSDTDSLIYP